MAFQEKFALYRKRLGSIGTNEPLAKFSVFLVILLDVFIFSMIWGGIYDNTKTIATPESYANSECRSVIDTVTHTDRYESAANVISRIENRFSYARSSYYVETSPYVTTVNGTAEGCQKLAGFFESASADPGLLSNIKALRDTQKSIEGAKTEKNTIQSSYDTMLLEKIAKQNENKSLTPESADTAKAKIAQIDQRIANLESQEKAETDAILNSTSVRGIYSTVSSYGPTVTATYDRLEFWYPVKTFAAQILFIIPLLVITVLWSNVSIRRNRGIQTLISSHLLAIISIFILIKVIQLIYDILPHAFLEKVLEFLEEWNIIGLWYYFLIFLGIAAVMGIVYFVQKKIFSRERLRARNADMGRCVDCAVKLQPGSEFCIRCGALQTVECPNCGNNVNVTSSFCPHCGVSMEKVEE